MKQLLFFLGSVLLTGTAISVNAQVPADKALNLAVKQYKQMMTQVPDTLMPRTTNNLTGQLITSDTEWWTSGFYPGALWYLYEYSKDQSILKEARKRTNEVQKEQYNKTTHDLGFMMYCSYGNAYRLTKDPKDKQVLITSARTLSTRFNPVVGCIKSWDHGKWKYPVIIDNMMNLELLTWASKVTGDTSFAHIARTHANTTMQHHFRPDYSSYHVIGYDPATGAVVAKNTAQGFADSSAWARGQAWGLYGYTMMYRETKNAAYLEQAKKIANYIIPHLPADKVPYWDFDAPDIPHAKRDASAGAVMAAALLELSQYTRNQAYFQTAEQILQTLCSDEYLAKEGTNNHFILKHSVGHLPANSEVDVPLTYADYYFVEALLRYKKYSK
ncbi:glycoside hydrolase family 88 protein [Chitinophaga sancti]|uniref:glycoside hydrolase family 88 protein n=1 Tax=Chitinophaga sancti TaxID=1004 RepID=UPI003F7A8A30